jgi:hypothetical protein
MKVCSLRRPIGSPLEIQNPKNTASYGSLLISNPVPNHAHKALQSVTFKHSGSEISNQILALPARSCLLHSLAPSVCARCLTWMAQSFWALLVENGVILKTTVGELVVFPCLRPVLQGWTQSFMVIILLYQWEWSYCLRCHQSGHYRHLDIIIIWSWSSGHNHPELDTRTHTHSRYSL